MYRDTLETDYPYLTWRRLPLVLEKVDVAPVDVANVT